MKKKATTNSASLINQHPIWLRLSLLILLVITAISFWGVLNLSHTNGDEIIFIVNQHEYLSHWSNFGALFTHSVFLNGDSFYRPILMFYFMVMNHLADSENIFLYHLSVLILHLVNVWLLNAFLKRMNIASENAFWLTLFFAIHPALTMAVAWIPGVNDILFTNFALLYFIQFVRINKVEKVNPIQYLVLMILFFLALFTKETGLFLPFGTALIYWFINPSEFKIKKIILFVIPIIALLIVWYVLRRIALLGIPSANFSIQSVVIFLHRLPGAIQYFSKAFLPINLNVWPLITSTNFYLFGAAVILVFLLLLLNKNRNYQSIIFGLIWLILFLIPTFFSTTTIFVYHEHRLYFPIIGLLFLLNQTELFASIHKNILLIKRVAMCLVAVLFIYQIHNYIPVFNDALSFQKNALDGSPDDAYLNSTYGIVLANNQQPKQALPYLRKSLKLDSALKNVRLFIARYDFIPNKKYDSAKIFMLDEIKRTPKFADNYYALSTIGFETKDYKFCEKYLEKYVQLRRDNIPIQEFLASIYVQNKNFTKAKFLCDSLTKSGNPINPDFYKTLMDSINAKK